VNISSMGGRFATPMGAWYHASKCAVEGLSAAMRHELKRFGINVVLIEPGSIQTEWGGVAAEKLRATSGAGPYAKQAHGDGRDSLIWPRCDGVTVSRDAGRPSGCVRLRRGSAASTASPGGG
jgi:NAD(P)-dependent dehydrogenase (short-subunit alcohol dehydrogenase family)